MKIEILEGSIAAPLVEPHYHRNGFPHLMIQSTEIILIATHGLPEVLGCVRFCIEEGIPLLRSMAVDEPFRGRGIGKALLLGFKEYLEKYKIQNTHLVCSARLNSFYEQVGFKRIDFSEAPLFLVERMKQRDPELIKMNCMKLI